MDKNSKIAFGITASVIVFQTYKIRKLTKWGTKLFEGMDILMNLKYQEQVDEEFEGIIENLD